MEHRLLLGGGERWLPLARSRIAMLKQLGRTFARESFEIDGDYVEVRVEPGQEFIRIEGGKRFTMDSGIVDVGSFGVNDPAKFLPGRLKKPYLVLEYDDRFTNEAHPPWWIRPRTSRSEGQLSGEVVYRDVFSGKIRKDGVPLSFTPDEVIAGDPPAQILNTSDEVLTHKKRAAMLCPASMFTGRARLYAQALYGQYLYANKVASSINEPPELVLSSGPPKLRLKNYKNPDSVAVEAFRKLVDEERSAAEAAGYGLTFKDPYSIMLDVSSGVFLDTITGRHWLISLSSTQATVHELVGSSQATVLRSMLRDSHSSALSEADRTHLEAYILATCRPNAESRRIYSLNTPAINPYSMGYGWHWNWSGTRADIVINNEFSQGGGNRGMESTHFRITMSRVGGEGAVSFSFYTGAIEGPTRWAVYRRSWSISHPSWLDRQTNLESPWPQYWTAKTTPKNSAFMAASGFFYVFYKKDEPQVCRVITREVGEAPAKDQVSSSDYWTQAGGYIRSTNSQEEGFHKHTDLTPAYKVCAFFVGAVNVGDVSYGRVEGGYEEKIHDKRDLGYGTGLWDFSFAWGVDHHLEYGASNGGSYEYAIVDGFLGTTRAHGCNMTYSANEFHEEWYESAAVTIPFYDAEAVYSRRYTRDDYRKINRENRFWSWPGFASSSCVTRTAPYDLDEYGVPTYLTRYPSSDIYTKTMSSFPGWWTVTWKPTEYPDDETQTTEIIQDKFYFRGGVKDATLGAAGLALGDIFSTDPDDSDYIPGLVITARSSTSFTMPVAFGLMPTVGAADTDIVGNTTLVGWI